MTPHLSVVGRGLAHVRSASARIRGGDVSFAALAFLVVFGSLLGVVVLQTLIIQNRVELDRVNVELELAREEHQRLRLEVLEREAPERILRAAIDRLGMIRPDERLYLPGRDPAVTAVRRPPATGDPFAPAPLPAELGGGDDPEGSP